MSPATDSAPLYGAIPSDVERRLADSLAGASSLGIHGGDRTVFFRVDDVGVLGDRFTRLVRLFRRHQVPLTLAVVPAWLTSVRWESLSELCGDARHSWGWVQHGWRHLNHEPRGKKQEFGPSRTQWQKRDDIRSGFQRLRTVMGESILPIFTPPWNRCDQKTLDVLEGMGCRAISRNLGAQPSASSALPDYPVSIDLHTRKETDAHVGWRKLFGELRTNLASGFCGIMIHHQRMNGNAYDFLNLLLSALKQQKQVRLVHLGTLLEEGFKWKA